jgi:DNA-binding CsgD family transcriptional regulator
MASPVDRPMVCPVVVGRVPHLAALAAHLEAARDGRGGTVLIAGEAGIGKSRLVAELRALATARGMHVLAGRCFEPDRVLPYAPLLDLLRALLAERPDGSVVQAFAALAPELAHLLPGDARVRTDAARTGALDPALEQRRLVRAWAELVIGLAVEHPALVVIEDLHWADDASLEALLAVARRLAGHPILFLLTYRTDELTPSLRHLLAQLDRDRLASEIVVTRLTLAEVDALLRAIFDQPQPIRADFLHAIFEITDGNPFFIEEVIRALVAGGDVFRADGRWERRALARLRIPRSAEDAVQRHSRLLSPEADEVLRVAAVAGRTFDFTLLAAVTGQDEPSLLSQMRELIRAQLVVEESAERFTFRHALTRQAIYAGMLARERRVLHRAIAETIVRLHAAGTEPFLADLAYHFAEGEAWEETLTFGERAGAQALALYAPRAAVEHFTRAIDAAALIAREPAAALHRARGQAFATLGEFDRAEADFQAALTRARADGDRVSEWQALLDLGTLWAGHDYARAGEFLTAALALARTLATPGLLAQSLLQMGSWYLNQERVDEAEECLQDALTIFEEIGDRRGMAQAVDLLGTVSDIAGDITRMRQRYERAAVLFRELGDRQALSSTLATMLIPGGAYIFETVAMPPYIPRDQTVRESEEAISLAREIGWRAGEAYAILNSSMHYAAYGDYRRAFESLQDGLPVAREIEHREWMTAGEWVHGMILAALLAPAQAQEHFERAYALGRVGGSLHWLHITSGMLAESRVALGNLAAASAILDELAPDLPMRTLGQRRIWLSRAKLALARGDAAGALEISERLIASAADAPGGPVIPLLELLRGECLVVLGRYAETLEPLGATASVTLDRGLLPILWQVRVALGRTSAALGAVSDAEAHYRSARTIIDRLAATIPDSALRDNFAERATALLPAEHGRAPGRGKSVLTGREREVALLVARGLSNRDVADALSIGERTVETHIGHILGKLGFASRVEIAAWAVAPGPTAPS